MKPFNVIYQQSIELLNAEEGGTRHLLCCDFLSPGLGI